jgi:hypothetical protein
MDSQDVTFFIKFFLVCVVALTESVLFADLFLG